MNNRKKGIHLYPILSNTNPKAIQVLLLVNLHEGGLAHPSHLTGSAFADVSGTYLMFDTNSFPYNFIGFFPSSNSRRCSQSYFINTYLSASDAQWKDTCTF